VRPLRTKYYHRLKRRIHLLISVSDIIPPSPDTNMFVSERRLEEERLQVEAKRREREEQHLFLTAKVSSQPPFLGALILV